MGRQVRTWRLVKPSRSKPPNVPLKGREARLAEIELERFVPNDQVELARHGGEVRRRRAQQPRERRAVAAEGAAVDLVVLAVRDRLEPRFGAAVAGYGLRPAPGAPLPSSIIPDLPFLVIPDLIRDPCHQGVVTSLMLLGPPEKVLKIRSIGM